MAPTSTYRTSPQATVQASKDYIYRTSIHEYLTLDFWHPLFFTFEPRISKLMLKLSIMTFTAIVHNHDNQFLQYLNHVNWLITQALNQTIFEAGSTLVPTPSTRHAYEQKTMENSTSSVTEVADDTTFWIIHQHSHQNRSTVLFIHMGLLLWGSDHLAICCLVWSSLQLNYLTQCFLLGIQNASSTACPDLVSWTLYNGKWSYVHINFKCLLFSLDFIPHYKFHWKRPQQDKLFHLTVEKWRPQVTAWSPF